MSTGRGARRSATTRTGLAAAVAAVATALGSCSLVPLPGRSGGAWTEAIRQLPAHEAGTSYLITGGDLAAASSVAGSARPDPGADPRRWAMDISTTEAAVELPDAIRFPAWNDPEGEPLGFNIADVDRFVQSQPPQGLTIVDLRDGAGLSDSLPTRDGLRVTGDGEIGQLAEDVSNEFGPVVTGMAERDGRVASGIDARVLRDWADDSGERLEDPAVLRAAEIADEEEAYALMIIGGEPRTSGAPSSPSGSPGASPRATITPCFEQVALLMLPASDRTRALVVYRFPGGAQEQVERVRQAWEGPSLTGTPLDRQVTVDEVTADGDEVRVRAHVADGPPGIFRQLAVRADAPFTCR